jgi:protein gp37
LRKPKKSEGQRVGKQGEHGISWTNHTWNPIRGCSRVSEGCRHCYAEGVAYRFSGPGQPYEGLVTIGVDGARRRQWNGNVRFVEEHLLDPLKWKTPRRVFVNSMSDLFHENVSEQWVDWIWGVMALCPQHSFQILTKRAPQMLAHLKRMSVRSPGPRERIWKIVQQMPGYDREHPKWTRIGANAFDNWPLPNVWLGVSVENQAAVDERIPLLLQTPAAVRFISAEPLLGPIDMGLIQRPPEFHRSPYGWHQWWPQKIHWVIVGGESGPNARPMHPDWARSIRDQCLSAGVPFFFKQSGEWASVSEVAGPGRHHSFPDGATVRRVGKKTAGALLDGREWRQFPEVRA